MSEDNRTTLIYYNEIGLKKRNRVHFEELLIRNIYRATRGLGVASVRRLYGRLRLDQHAGGDPAELEERLGRLFGIAHFDPVEVLGWDLDRVREILGRWAREGGFESFAVRARRVNKGFPHTSDELNRELGALVKEESGARVDLEHPQRTFGVLILNREIFVFHRRNPGPGGLPVGSAGRVALLLSGGIDSPVAAERLLRRGCQLLFVHFHSAPFTDRSSQEKAVELAEILCRHRLATKIHLVPLGALQRKIVAEAPAPYRVMLYRRFMLRIAERLARASRCLALATGECLAQVASQTLENLAVLDRTVPMPVLRPLIARDKQEIVDEARRIGTFETSIEPDADCCGYLMPRNPVIRARLHEIEEIEETLAAEEIVEEIAAAIETRDIEG
ncbi:MAG: tRNA uracil 4-sulfurtransferase ThiI [Planctomycetota bacterium]